MSNQQYDFLNDIGADSANGQEVMLRGVGDESQEIVLRNVIDEVTRGMGSDFDGSVSKWLSHQLSHLDVDDNAWTLGSLQSLSKEELINTLTDACTDSTNGKLAIAAEPLDQNRIIEAIAAKILETNEA